MLAFQVTIRLEQAFDRDYAALHDMMFKQGFFRSVHTDEGNLIELPPMEYSHYSAFDLSPMVIHAKVTKIAAKTGKRYSVIVSKYNAIARSMQQVMPERMLGTL